MSWDILIMNSDCAPADITCEWVPTSMGDVSAVRDKIEVCFPGYTWDSDIFEGDGFSIEFALEHVGPIASFMLHVRGGGDAVAAIGHMCKTNGWAALDLSEGELMDFGAASNESWERFQAYRDRVINQTAGAEQTARNELGDLMQGLLMFSKEMIADAGRFNPHGAVIDSKGVCVAVAAFDAYAKRDAGKTIKMLLEDFRAAAKAGNYRAAGFAFEVIVPLPSTAYKTRAIAMRLEHGYGFSTETFFPYALNSEGKATYGKMFGQEVDAVIFENTDGALSLEEGNASADPAGERNPIEQILSADEKRSDPDSSTEMPGTGLLLVMAENREVVLDLGAMEKKLLEIPGISNLHLDQQEFWIELVGEFELEGEEATVAIAETGITLSPQCGASLFLALEIQKRLDTALHALGGGPWFDIPLQGIKSLDEFKKMIDQECE